MDLVLGLGRQSDLDTGMGQYLGLRVILHRSGFEHLLHRRSLGWFRLGGPLWLLLQPQAYVFGQP